MSLTASPVIGASVLPCPLEVTVLLVMLLIDSANDTVCHNLCASAGDIAAGIASCMLIALLTAWIDPCCGQCRVVSLVQEDLSSAAASCMHVCAGCICLCTDHCWKASTGIQPKPSCDSVSAMLAPHGLLLHA